MQTKFSEYLRARGPSSVSLLNKYYDPLPEQIIVNAEGRSVHVPKDQAETEVLNCYESVYPATSLPGNAWGNNIDIRVPTAALGLINQCFGEFQITNSDASNTITLLPIQECINYVEIYAANGNVLIQRITGHALWCALVFLTQDQVVQGANVWNQTAAFAAGSAIGTTSTVSYFCPLLGMIFDQLQVFWPSIKSDLLVRFNMQPLSIAQITNSGSITPTISAFNLHFLCQEMSPSQYEAKMRDYSSSPHVLKYLSPQVQPQSVTFVASSTTNFTLQGVVGTAAFALFTIRASTVGASSGAITLNGNLTSFALLDASGQNINGGSVKLSSVNRFIETPLYLPNEQFTSIKALYSIMHCVEPLETFNSGKFSGSQTYNGQNQLQLTSNASLSGATTVDFMLWTYAQMRIENGQVSILQS